MACLVAANGGSLRDFLKIIYGSSLLIFTDREREVVSFWHPAFLLTGLHHIIPSSFFFFFQGSLMSYLQLSQMVDEALIGIIASLAFLKCSIWDLC